MSRREDFESAYAADMKQRGRPVTVVAFWRNADDSYALPIVDRAWWAWQASREALEIQLPDPHWFGDAQIFYKEDIQEAIEASGVKVKP